MNRGTVMGFLLLNCFGIVNGTPASSLRLPLGVVRRARAGKQATESAEIRSMWKRGGGHILFPLAVSPPAEVGFLSRRKPPTMPPAHILLVCFAALVIS